MKMNKEAKRTFKSFNSYTKRIYADALVRKEDLDFLPEKRGLCEYLVASYNMSPRDVRQILKIPTDATFSLALFLKNILIPCITELNTLKSLDRTVLSLSVEVIRDDPPHLKFQACLRIKSVMQTLADIKNSQNHARESDERPLYEQMLYPLRF